MRSSSPIPVPALGPHGPASSPRGVGSDSRPRPDTEKHYRRCVARALVHIHQSMNEGVRLGEISRMVNMAPCHFHSVFRALMGYPLQKYVRMLRLERAAFLLLYTQCPVLRIALETGYDSHEAFSRVFKRVYAVSPTQYRQAHEPGDAGGATPMGIAGEAALVEWPVLKERDQPPLRLAYVHYFGPYNERMGAWDLLARWANRCGVEPEALRPVGLLHDYPELISNGRIRYDAGVVLDRPLPLWEAMGEQWLPGRRYLVMAHAGSGASLAQAHLRLANHWATWARRPRHQALPILEVYRDFPAAPPLHELCVDLGMALS